MWIDTHCHLDAAEFDPDRDVVFEAARAAKVDLIVVPAVERANFGAVANLARRHRGVCYALGIHPMYVPRALDEDLERLRDHVAEAMHDPSFVAIGEIGLDFFIPALCEPELRTKQERFYQAQLKLAREFGLPVLLHVRRSQDVLLKYLRRIEVSGGCAHAFNGSLQQAQQFVDMGFALGIGGAMTFSRALQIRRLAGELPLSNLVLETDAPDIAPAWIHPGRNEPAALAAIGEQLATLRSISVAEVMHQTTSNARQVLPRLPQLI